MNKINITVNLTSYLKDELPGEIADLFQKALGALNDSYSPYSKFKVAAAVLLENGTVLTGTNQENASYPAGICAEGTVMSACAALHPDIAPKAIFITVKGEQTSAKAIVAPCGICRQRLVETEFRYKKNLEIWLGVEGGDIIRINSAKDLLPLAFTPDDLK